ncbi:hypothetical protein CLV78_10729 [Aliiruegeria haliotis]|uniref:SPW repeat-containing protein n=1 Tax=Aliiruegeria haliotis TaxID=1280846 RepID=A0A2T0RLN7_9RHOB|nr:hypothetical protein [Aliiruegeria haliotis]PRY22105.1 hypothetical protein CLV78_10729 [Aliiruegeria haliotis]
MSRLFHADHRPHLVALVAGAVAFLLPYFIGFSPEKAVGAHLIGVTLMALGSKAVWRPGKGDDLLLIGGGALAILVPVFAWQMPSGSAWAFPVLGTIVAIAAIRHMATDLVSNEPEGTNET